MITCPEWLYIGLATLLCLVNFATACTNLLALPGNWLMLLTCSAFAFLFRSSGGRALDWSGIVVLLILALVGEGIEMLTGTLGIAKLKASRRSIALSLVGSIAGSLAGAAIGIPIPILGPAIGALGGGAVGALAGAFIGEDWTGQSIDQSWAVGRAAFWGRLWGTFGKFAVGILMAVWSAIDVLTIAY